MHPTVEQLVEQVLPQADRIAKQVYSTAPYALELDELRSLAYLGLMMAAVRWPDYCAENNYDVGAVQFFNAYATKRMRGAIVDAMRASDYATRSMRSKAKELRSAGQDMGATEAELSSATGMSPQEIRATLAHMAAKPVSFNADESLDAPDPIDVESSAVLSTVLVTTVEVLKTLPWSQQVVLALCFFEGRELREVAKLMQMSEPEVSRLRVEAVLAAHNAMLAAVREEA